MFTYGALSYFTILYMAGYTLDCTAVRGHGERSLLFPRHYLYLGFTSDMRFCLEDLIIFDDRMEDEHFIPYIIKLSYNNFISTLLQQ